MFVLRFNRILFIYFLALQTYFLWASEKVIKEESKTVYKKETIIDFSEFYIAGELMRPDGAYVKNRKKTKFNSLIELRSHFRPELLRSVNDL